MKVINFPGKRKPILSEFDPATRAHIESHQREAAKRCGSGLEPLNAVIGRVLAASPQPNENQAT